MERDLVLRRLRRTTAALGLLTVVLVGAALWLALANPAIDDTSRGSYRCLAPWDTALNDADNYPGGEPPPDGDDIASRCRAAGEDRFDQAVGVGVAAGVAAVATLGVGIAASLRDRGVL